MIVKVIGTKKYGWYSDRLRADINVTFMSMEEINQLSLCFCTEKRIFHYTALYEKERVNLFDDSM